MKTKEEGLQPIEEPIGNFILNNLPFEKRFQTANGIYIHYSDVCVLLQKYASQFKAGEPYRLERPVEGGVIGTEYGCNNVWISPTGALMSDNDYQFLSDSQKEQMRPYKQDT